MVTNDLRVNIFNTLVNMIKPIVDLFGIYFRKNIRFFFSFSPAQLDDEKKISILASVVYLSSH